MDQRTGTEQFDRSQRHRDDRGSRMDVSRYERLQEEDRGEKMSRRRPMGAAIAGAALAVGVGVWQAMRMRRRNEEDYDQQKGRARGTRDAKKQTLIGWLNDAYSMEKSVVQTLRNHAHSAQNRPELQSRLERHLEESKEHAHMVRECIERLGGSVSTFKTGLGQVVGSVQGMVNAPAKDELVKNILADSATERFEIASYQGIITAAEEIGDTQTAQICRRILREEEQMLEWLEQQLPNAIRSQMARA